MKISPKTKELLRYVVVGGLAVVIDSLAYFILSGTTGLSASASKRISFTLGAIWAFFANKYFTFRQPVPRMQEPVIFVAVYIVGFLLNSFIHDYVFHVSSSKLFSFAVATMVSTIVNYIGQKWLVFRTRS